MIYEIYENLYHETFDDKGRSKGLKILGNFVAQIIDLNHPSEKDLIISAIFPRKKH